MLTVSWDIKGPMSIDSLEKDAIVNSASYYQLPYLLNDFHMKFVDTAVCEQMIINKKKKKKNIKH